MPQLNQKFFKLLFSTITFGLLLTPQVSVAITNASSIEKTHNVSNGPTPNDIPISTTTRNANCQGPAVICKNYIQFGFIGETIAKANKDLPQLTAATAHKPSLTLWFQDFSEKLNVKQLKASSKNGQLPVITWEPQKLNDKIPDNYPLKDIAAGKFDKYLISSAKLAKWVRVPFVIRFAHEMNGYWYPWGQPKPGDPRSLAAPTNTPEQYINAYRHVHDVFQSVGAKNVIWMWSPNLVDATPTISLKSLYPGDSYIDVMGLSGYLRDQGQTFNTRFPRTLQQLSEISSTKPIIIAETAVARKLNRTLLIKDLLKSLAHCAQIQGLLWLNKTTPAYDFNISKDQDGLLALKGELAQPRFNPMSGLRFSYPGIPAIAGSLTIGSTLAATGSYWGHPTSVMYNWFSCPSATDLETDCRQIERGRYHYLNEADRHRYLHLVTTTKSPLGIDSATSAVAGPVMFIPETPIVSAVNLRGTSTQLVFGSVATTATNLQVQVDNQTPIYLPTNSSEYWITGLTLGESHTFKVSFIDVFGQSKSVGTPATGSFTAAKSPDAPKLTISPTTMTVQFPTPATGQSYWKYWIDTQQPTTVDITTTTLELPVSEVGPHTFNLVNISGDGSTLTKITNFQILPAPIVSAVNLRGTSTQLVFGSVATTATNLQVQVDNQTPIYLPTNSSEYWITGLTLGESHTFKVSFIDVFGQSKSVGTPATGSFTAAKSPDAPKLTISPTTMTVQFPTPATGQSYWKYWIDTQQPTTVDITTTTLELPVSEVGPHTFNLVNISGDGSTLTKITNFQILPAPIVSAVNLRGTSTQLVFASPPAGVSKLVIRTAEGNTTYLPANTTEYWLTKLTPGQLYACSITYQALVAGAYFEGLATNGKFAALSTPIHATVAVDGKQITILFPAAASGQSNWRYWIDSDPAKQVPANRTSAILSDIPQGAHRVWIQAVGQDGITLSVSQPFEIAN